MFFLTLFIKYVNKVRNFSKSFLEKSKRNVMAAKILNANWNEILSILNEF